MVSFTLDVLVAIGDAMGDNAAFGMVELGASFDLRVSFATSLLFRIEALELGTDDGNKFRASLCGLVVLCPHTFS